LVDKYGNKKNLIVNILIVLVIKKTQDNKIKKLKKFPLVCIINLHNQRPMNLFKEIAKNRFGEK